MHPVWLGAAVHAGQEERAQATKMGLNPTIRAEIKTGGAESPASRDGRSLLQRPHELFPGQRHSWRTLALWQELRQSRA